MNHRDKIDFLIKDLKERGIEDRGLSGSLLHRILWTLGWKLPPPVFLGYWVRLSQTVLWYAILVSFVSWQVPSVFHPQVFGFPYSIVSALILGVAVTHQSGVRQHHQHFHDWSQYPDL